MAKKKAVISDLIKSDMSRRAIGEEHTITEGSELFTGGETVQPSENTPREESTALASADKTAPAAAFPILQENQKSRESVAFMDFIAAHTQSVGLTSESDMRNFYAFLQGQAMRYLRGFDAGHRFHG